MSSSMQRPDGGGISRRRFLQAAIGASVAGVALPSWMGSMAGAASAPTDGTVVVVTLRGGCDPLDVVMPTNGPARASYEVLRGAVARSTAGAHALSDTEGLHEALGSLAARFDRGDVAIVRGVGLANLQRSHFAASAMMAASNIDGTLGTGWLGRMLDTMSPDDSALRGVAIGPLVPNHLRGRRSSVTTLPVGQTLWGSDPSYPWDGAAFDAVRAFAAGSTELGALGMSVSAAGAQAVDAAGVVGAFPGLVDASANQLRRSLELAGLVVNADVGVRVITTDLGGFDTHAEQGSRLAAALSMVDEAIERFFEVLDPTFASRVVVLVESEFGRTAEANSSRGTDHGHAGLSLLIGQNVVGGLHGAPFDLEHVGPHSTLTPEIDHREIHATVIGRWLGGDVTEVLGGSFTQHEMFSAPPGT